MNKKGMVLEAWTGVGAHWIRDLKRGFTLATVGLGGMAMALGGTDGPKVMTSPVIRTPASSGPVTVSTPPSASGSPQVGAAWTNSLGMVFRPVPGTRVLFSQYDTRVKDYQAFVTATATVDQAGKKTERPWEKPYFAQTGDHPVVEINWTDAKAFCDWLTSHDRAAGKLTGSQHYRLPTNDEWSLAAGGAKYPWGASWPPPKGFGNYSERYTHDGYAETSPVGSFHPNAYGLYDMGGNVWQWCDDHANVRLVIGILENWRVLRGGSWYDDGPESMELSYQRIDHPDATMSPFVSMVHYGFRCVLAY